MRDHSSRRRLAAVAVFVALAFVAASCGDDSDSDSSSDTTGGAATTAAGAATTGGGAATTGGSDVDLTGQTIKLGVANNEGPALSLPEFRHGVEVAVDYVNANGGINGAEIEIIECINDGSPEGSVNCANQFVDEGAVAYFAAIDVGADAALPILTSAGIPYVSTEPWGATQKTDPISWILGAPQGAYTAGPLQALADLGAKEGRGVLPRHPDLARPRDQRDPAHRRGVGARSQRHLRGRDEPRLGIRGGHRASRRRRLDVGHPPGG